MWVGIQYDEGFNPEPVMTSATEILKAELNEFLAAPIPKVAPCCITMPCTRQGAKVCPLRGQSLRGALQVKAGVVRIFSGSD